jgi:hypothetical protein
MEPNDYMPTTRLTTEIIKAAILGFEEQKRRISAQIAELRAMMPGGNTNGATRSEPTARRRKKFSAASRRKMALAQKARWAKIKGESEVAAPSESVKPKRRKMSAAARIAIGDAQRKRWTVQKAAGKR